MILLNGLPAYLGVGILHLTLINFIVIYIEAILLKKVSQINDYRFRYIVLANLISALLGILVASIITDKMGGNFWDGNVNEMPLKRPFIIGLIMFILLTILIEAPFYFWALRKKKLFSSAFIYSIVINLITNIPIALYYYIEKLNYIDD